MTRMIARISCTILLAFVFVLPVFAQPSPPTVLLEELPGCIRGGSARLDIDEELSFYDPGVAWFQYRRVSIAPAGVFDATSGWVRETHFTFTGVEDSTVAGYQVRVAHGADTSAWSDLEYPSGVTFVVIHDLDPPRPVSNLSACWDGEAINLTWVATTDGACGVAAYYIFRNDGAASRLRFITDLDMYRREIVVAGERMVYEFTDDLVTFGRTYNYTVVPVDEVGHFWPENAVVTKRASGPHDCYDLPPMAPLAPIARYTDAEYITVSINTAIYTPNPHHRFKYRMIDITDPFAFDTVTTPDWTNSHSYTFNLEECRTYRFEARCTSLTSSSTPVSRWSHSHEDAWLITTRDTEGPMNADSIAATPREAGIYVQFWLPEGYTTDDLDCGSGWRTFHLFRVHSDSLFGDLFRNIGDYPHYQVAQYDATYGMYPYSFWDDGPMDPIVDLIDEECYTYFVFARDHIGHWSAPMDVVVVEACVDKGVVPPQLLSLPLWTGGLDVTLEILDTSYCDMTEITFEYAPDADFGYSVSPTAWYNLRPDGDLGYTDCSPTAHVSFNKTFLGLSEGRYCFRAKAGDAVGSESEWSETVCTNLDNTPPTVVRIDSVRSRADSTETIVVDIYWRHSYDARSGVDLYEVWHSDDPLAPFGTLLGIVTRFQTHYRHNDPDPTDNFSNNYYTIVSVDKVGNKNVNPGELNTRGFRDCSPPHAPVIDTIYYEVVGTSRHYVIEWTDPTPAHCAGHYTHCYRIMHANSHGFLFSGDTAVLISFDGEFCGRRRTTIPRESITHLRSYFQMSAVNMDNNESGYSQVYEYINEVDEEVFMLSLAAGWNLISIPVYRDDIADDFDRAGITDIYAWNPAERNYYATDELLPGYGYWVFVGTARDVELSGFPVETIHIPIENNGWFIVGSTYYSDITYHYTGDLRVGPWNYNTATGGFDAVSVLNPGYGYWVLFATTDNTWQAPGYGKFVHSVPGYLEQYDIFVGSKKLTLAINPEALDLFDSYDKPLPPATPGGQRTAYLQSDDGYMLSLDARSVASWDLAIAEISDVSWSDLDGSLLIDGKDYGASNTTTLFPGIYKVEVDITKAESFELVGAYPNPFNSATNIVFTLPEAGEAKIEIFDNFGRAVTVLHDGEISKGRHSIVWNGFNDNGIEQASGVYFCRVSYNNQSATKRLLFVR